MAGRLYATIGRSPDCDVVLDHPTVSAHHARLSWAGATLLVEDLSSANGVLVDGQKIRSARVRPGADIRCGAVSLPWSHEGLRVLLRAGAGNRTLVMPLVGRGSYVCGACGHLGQLPEGKTPAKLVCEKCNASLRVRSAEAKRGGGLVAFATTLLVLAALGGAVWWLWLQPVLEARAQAARTGEPVPAWLPAPAIPTPPPETTASRIAKAFDPMDPVARNAAARLAARSQGPFHVEQVAEIWTAVRREWRYVNDPRGRDYFATARETIENGYVGDCDDFAIVLATMVTAVGGEARIVLMSGPEGGHAYTEACVHGEPQQVALALGRHYRARWRQFLGGTAVPRTIAYRRSESCPIWLNLDWNAAVPGGPYEAETEAIAITEDGRTETLAPAPAPTKR